MAAPIRVLVLGLSAALCSLLAGFAALYTATYGASGWDDLIAMASELMICGAMIGFAFSVWALWRVKPTQAVPRVIAVTVATAAFSGPICGALYGVLPLVAGLVTMFWCRRQLPPGT